jgi:hypothetical protein
MFGKITLFVLSILLLTFGVEEIKSEELKKQQPALLIIDVQKCFLPGHSVFFGRYLSGLG